jgi:hypothetical protein
MIIKPANFDLEELVCPHVYYRFGETAWQFFQPAILELMDWVRNTLNRPVFVNNWDQYKDSDYIKAIKDLAEARQPIINTKLPKAPDHLLDERGLRCNLCSLNLSKTYRGTIYVSPHFTGQAADYDVQGMLPEEVRQWLIKNQSKLPHCIRLEKGVSWVHMDCRDAGVKVFQFNP